MTVCLKWSIPTARALAEDGASKERRVRDPSAGMGRQCEGQVVATELFFQMGSRRVGNSAGGGKFRGGWEILQRVGNPGALVSVSNRTRPRSYVGNLNNEANVRLKNELMTRRPDRRKLGPYSGIQDHRVVKERKHD